MDALSATRIVGAPSHESSRPSPRPRNVAGGFPSGSTQVRSTQGAGSAAAQPAGPEVVQQLAAELGNALSRVEGDFSVSVDEDSGMVVVRITDEVTGEIVKQLPPEELIEVGQSMEKIVGLLIDDLA